MAAPIIEVRETEAEVARELCSLVAKKANQAIEQKGVFTVGVSGGSLQKHLCNGLPGETTDWTKWHIFFCDERVVPFDNDDSTYKYYRDNLLGKVPLPKENLVPIDPSLPASEAATDYISKLRKVFPGTELPRFDMLLLGMGPDGHTCSLFPGHKLLDVTDVIVASITDSPKPPPQRITLTLPVVNNTACAVFMSCGESKAEILKRVLEGSEADPLPAARVRPTNGELHWFLDQSAAKLLKS
ncbi:6-phosphogluconolactonase [Lingula anatina]|uniref:6-phosphogluconolactonase n=1 Tax=Lingula anatina TaxID=7574 RepID=A0A1S3KGS3_LINAN|nr:6-phosphogluconolactonase [Lingula anatina]|eukprot:XP_013421431.1 6-phosphogluconolactonase [Lingula anatina]